VKFLVAMHDAVAALYLALGVKIRAGACSSARWRKMVCGSWKPPAGKMYEKQKPRRAIAKRGSGDFRVEIREWVRLPSSFRAPLRMDWILLQARASFGKSRSIGASEERERKHGANP
jgi:hypothetical protein